MANTDNTQAKITTNNTNLADSLVTSSTSSAATRLTTESNTTVKKIMQTDAPLIRYFDIVDETNHSYVLGYN